MPRRRTDRRANHDAGVVSGLGRKEEEKLKEIKPTRAEDQHGKKGARQRKKNKEKKKKRRKEKETRREKKRGQEEKNDAVQRRK
jgi:hydrocephalus-inducing protein